MKSRPTSLQTIHSQLAHKARVNDDPHDNSFFLQPVAPVRTKLEPNRTYLVMILIGRDVFMPLR